MKNIKKLTTGYLTQRSGQVQSVSARQYLNLSPEDKGRIGSVRVVASKLGEAMAFGHIELTYK